MSCFYPRCSQVADRLAVSYETILNLDHVTERYACILASKSESDIKSKLHDFDSLLARVQMSRAQLIQSLAELEAVELDGKYRMLQPDYLFEVLESIMNWIAASRVGYESVNVEDCLNAYVCAC
jgi:hypothetical protein